jgi:hypothetical protein
MVIRRVSNKMTSSTDKSCETCGTAVSMKSGGRRCPSLIVEPHYTYIGANLGQYGFDISPWYSIVQLDGSHPYSSDGGLCVTANDHFSRSTRSGGPDMSRAQCRSHRLRWSTNWISSRLPCNSHGQPACIDGATGACLGVNAPVLVATILRPTRKLPVWCDTTDTGVGPH